MREYIWLGNRPLAQLERKIKPNGTTRKAKISYLHVDHLNTPRKASDENGNIVWEWQSDAFGAGKSDRDADGNGQKTNIRLRFPGQYADAESGLFYNNQRDYDPKLGRYIQSDPIGLHGGINRYGYVGGNPVGFVDPSGLATRIISANCSGSIDKTMCGTVNMQISSSGTYSFSPAQSNPYAQGDPTGESGCTGGFYGLDGGWGYRGRCHEAAYQVAKLGKCPPIDNLELDLQSQYDLQQIMEVPSKLKFLQMLTIIATVMDISDPSGTISLALTGESWSVWSEAIGGLTPFAVNRIETLAVVAMFRYDYTTQQSRKHKQFWRAIADGCLTL